MTQGVKLGGGEIGMGRCTTGQLGSWCGIHVGWAWPMNTFGLLSGGAVGDPRYSFQYFPYYQHLPGVAVAQPFRHVTSTPFSTTSSKIALTRLESLALALIIIS